MPENKTFSAIRYLVTIQNSPEDCEKTLFKISVYASATLADIQGDKTK